MSFPGNMGDIDSRRLLLRPMKMEDAEQMFKVYSDPEVMKYWATPPFTDLASAQKFVQEDIESDARGDSLNWAITLKPGSEVIGKCILFSHNDSNRRAEIGFILNRLYWRQGLMSEAMVGVINLAFEDLVLHRLEADTDPENAGSLALLEKLGFQREGLFRDRWNVYDEWQDSVMLGLLKPDWDSGRIRS